MWRSHTDVDAWIKHIIANCIETLTFRSITNQTDVSRCLNRANCHRRLLWAHRHFLQAQWAKVMFYQHILTLVGLNVKINHEINNVHDLTAALSMNGTLSRMTLSQVQCVLNVSPYIIEKLVTTAINGFGAMVTKNISSRIIAHANL